MCRVLFKVFFAKYTQNSPVKMSKRNSVQQKEQNVADIRTTFNTKNDCLGISNDVKLRLTKTKNADDEQQR